MGAVNCGALQMVLRLDGCRCGPRLYRGGTKKSLAERDLFSDGGAQFTAPWGAVFLMNVVGSSSPRMHTYCC